MTSTQDLKHLAVDTWVTTNQHESTFFRIVRTPNYALDLEEVQIDGLNVLLIHFEVFTWTPSVMREMLRDWPGVRAKIDSPILACVEQSDSKWVRFVSRFGFVFLSHAIDYEGRDILVFANYRH